MITKKTSRIFVFVLLIPVIAVASDLYHLEVNQKSKEGKDLIMVFDEIERQDKFSIVRVKHISGASVPSIMFMVKGCYEIAKIRGVNYFINLKEWSDAEGNWMYKIGYTSDKNNNPKVYFGNDIDKSKELQYESVDDYKVIFERK